MTKTKIGMWLTAAAVWTAAAAFPAPPAETPTKIRLEEVLTIGGPDEETLFQWTGVAVDESGAIYVLDALDFSLKKFDAQGRLLKKTGRKGQGPGEFSMPRWLAVDKEYVFASDQPVAGLCVFDRDLNFRKTIRLSGLVDALESRPGGGVAVVVSNFQDPGRIVLLDRRGEVEGEVRYMTKSEGPLLDSVNIAAGPGEVFTLGFLFQDKVEKWDAAGLMSWTANLFGGKAVETKMIGGFALPQDTCVLDVAVDGRGRTFALGGKRAKNRGRDVFVLNPEGKVEATFVLPEPSHCLYIDDRNFLYVRADDGITLKKYRMVFE